MITLYDGIPNLYQFMSYKYKEKSSEFLLQVPIHVRPTNYKY